MFQRLKRLFTRRSDRLVLGEPPPVLAPREPAKPVGARPATAAAPTARTVAPAAAPAKAAVAPTTPKPGGPAPAAPPASDQVVKLALRQVLLKLPDSIKPRVRQAPGGNVQISLPAQPLLPHLARGSVKISFGELRRASPPGIFSDVADQDQVPVELPLQDILSQVGPQFLPRRSGQKKVEVPDDVAPVFGGKGAAMTGVRVAARPAKAEAATHASTAEAPPVPVFPVAPTAEPALRTTTAPVTPSTPLPSPATLRPAGPPTSPRPPGMPARPAAPVPPPSAARPAPAAAAPPTRPAAPAPAITPAPTAGPTEMVQVPLASVTMGWPEAIRQVLAGLNNPDAVVMLPAAELEQGLKKGKVVFQWKRIKSFVRPPLKSALPPAVEETQVEFPLPIIAPLFLSQRKPVAQQKKFVVAEDIPDVFSGKGLLVPPAGAPARAPTPARAPAPAPAPTPTPAPLRPPAPAPVRPTAAPAPAVAPAPAPAPAAGLPAALEIGEIFGQPGRKNWSPAEIVERSSGLDGVVGAIITMPDGLLVASHLPPGLNGEAIAAFLPQMFTRMMQYCKELKFGDATRLTIVVDGVPLKIVKVGGVFFAAVGRAEDPLPEAQLNVIAAHLSPQSK